MTFFSQDRVAAVDKAIMRGLATLREIRIGHEAISPVLNMTFSQNLPVNSKKGSKTRANKMGTYGSFVGLYAVF